jgi:hydroxymethylbilane synthase
VQVRAGDRFAIELVEPLHDPATGLAVRAERRLMLQLDGGCRLPVGALGTLVGHAQLDLLGGLSAADGRGVVIDRLVGPLEQPEALADALAARLRLASSAELIA